MDESFQHRTGPFEGESDPAPLDYSMLSAALMAQQLATPAARAQARFDTGGAPQRQADALVDTMVGASARLGCFNRTEVRRRLNTP